MPYTVHTLDGQAHTYPDTSSARLTDAGLLTIHEGVPHFDEYGETQYGPLLTAYPAGQWTHHHVEPAPYDTDAQASEKADVVQSYETQINATVEGKDKWQSEFQRHLDAGRKAARAR